MSLALGNWGITELKPEQKERQENEFSFPLCVYNIDRVPNNIALAWKIVSKADRYTGDVCSLALLQWVYFKGTSAL